MGLLTEPEARHRLAVQQAPEIILSTFQSSPGVTGTHSHTWVWMLSLMIAQQTFVGDELAPQPNNYILSEAIITPSSNGLGKCLLIEESTAGTTLPLHMCKCFTMGQSLLCDLFDCILMLLRLTIKLVLNQRVELATCWSKLTLEVLEDWEQRGRNYYGKV